MECSILKLSDDSASLLASFLPPRELRLLKVSSPSFWRKICTGSHLTELRFDSSSDSGAWLADLTRLQHVFCTVLLGSEVPRADWIFNLPKGLKTLHVRHPGSQGMLMRTLTPEEALLDPALLPISGGNLVPLHLNELFPCLESLELTLANHQCSYMRQVSGSHFEAVAWTLASHSDFVSHLPASLTHCSLAFSEKISQYNPLSLLKTDHLTSLTLNALRARFGWDPEPGTTISLPPHLETLNIFDHHMGDVIDNFKLPISLTRLRVYGVDLFLLEGEKNDDDDFGDEDHSDDEQEAVGEEEEEGQEDEEEGEEDDSALRPIQRLVNLTELTLDAGETLWEQKWFKMLPKKLRKLDIINVVHFRKCKGPIQWPPALSSLHIEADHTDCSGFQWPRKLDFPPTLTHLHLGVYIENSTNFYRYKLPAALTSLSLTGFIYTARNPFVKLPRTLRRLAIHDDTDFELEHLADLPPGLEELQLNSFGNGSRSSLDYIADLPPGLEELQLNSFGNGSRSSLDYIAALPHSLRRVSTGLVAMLLSDLPAHFPCMTEANLKREFKKLVQKLRPHLSLVGRSRSGHYRLILLDSFDGNDRFTPLTHWDLTKVMVADNVVNKTADKSKKSKKSKKDIPKDPPKDSFFELIQLNSDAPGPSTLLHLESKALRFGRDVIDVNWRAQKPKLETLVASHLGAKTLPSSLTSLEINSAPAEALLPLVNLVHLHLNAAEEKHAYKLIPPSKHLQTIKIHWNAPDLKSPGFKTHEDKHDIYFSYRHYDISMPSDICPIDKLPVGLRTLEGSFQLRLSDLPKLTQLRQARVDAICVDAALLASVAPKQIIDTSPRALLSFLPALLAAVQVEARVNPAHLLLERVDESSLVSLLHPSAHTLYVSALTSSLQQTNFDWAKPFSKLSSLTIANDLPWSHLPFAWPASLTSLVTPCSGFTANTYQALPASLTALTLCAEEKLEHPESLSRLASNVHTLYICAADITDQLIASLPPSITHLTLQGKYDKHEEARKKAELPGNAKAKRSTFDRAVGVIGGPVGAFGGPVGVFRGSDDDDDGQKPHEWPPLPPALVSLTILDLGEASRPSNLANVVPPTLTLLTISDDIKRSMGLAFSDLKIPGTNRGVPVRSFKFPGFATIN